MNSVDLSILIVNWNTRSLLERCLRSVYATVQSRTFEVIVIDNGSTDGSQAMVRTEFPEVRLIENSENLGFARANNQGIRVSRGRYILLLNSDAFLTGSAAETMADLLDRVPSIGIAGANLRFEDGSPQPSYGPLPTFRSEIQSLLGLDKNVQTAEANTDGYVEAGRVDGACLMARREVFDQVGLLDENFFMYSEEVDFCYRAVNAGWKVAHVPGAEVIHTGGGSSGRTPGRFLMLYRGKLQYFAKHAGPQAARRLRSAMQTTALLKLVIYSLARKLSMGRIRKDELWRQVYEGLANL